MFNIWKLVKRLLKWKKEYDVTIMQTKVKGDEKGYKQVYRLTLKAGSHDEATQKVFQMFNVADTLPKDFQARYIGTGDVILIDEGRRGKFYYKLWSGGWKPVPRIQIR
ncbi:YodL domain-containing protein [Bacillus sp. CGMCC 1.16541]|uniref:YodL domain-containing protein n=1 Tax=Bacillus sp. CGMCC 1.16541 TaxID=2185143 RepID=UPI0031BAE22C